MGTRKGTHHEDLGKTEINGSRAKEERGFKDGVNNSKVASGLCSFNILSFSCLSNPKFHDK